MAAARSEQRAGILAEVERLLPTEPDLAEREVIDFPYRTDVYTTRRP